MKLLKKFLSLIYYIALVLIAVFAINSNGLNGIFDSMKSSDGSVLVKVANYFKHADTWNLIFFFMFFAASIGLMMIFNLLYDRFFRFLSKRYSFLRFLTTTWSDWTIQKGAALLTIVFLFWAVSNIIIPVQASKYMVNSIQEIPQPMPVLVLGTSKMLTSGKGENLYYTYRINAAVELYEGNKALFFILSGDGGDGRNDGYDETRDMKDDLIKRGIPESKIKIDTAGFRTLDSILRLRVLFKLNEIIIVSQEFHQPRSIFLSSFYGLKPYGYSAKGSATFAMVKREAISSRPGMILDLIFANMQPRILAPGQEVYQFREDFEAKSDFHILILVGLFILVFVMIMGFGVYQSKDGEERSRAVKKYVYGGSGIFVVLIVMIASVYKNLDIKFINETVESIAKVVGVETEKMVEKRAVVAELIKKEEETKKTVALEKLKVKDSVSISSPLPENVIEKASPVKINVVVVDKSVTTKEIVKDSAFNAVSIIQTNEPVKKKNGFNVAKVNMGTTGTSVNAKLPTEFFTVKVHNTQPIANESTVFLRTGEPVIIDGKTISPNTVFAAKASVFNGKINFVVTSINDIPVNCKTYNFSDKQEGMKIEDRFYQSGKLVLSDGEPLLLSKVF